VDATYDVFMSGAGVELGEEGFEHEQAGDERSEEAGGEKDERDGSGGTGLALANRGVIDELGAAALDAEGTAGLPADGEHALTHSPPLGEGDGPEDEQG
jgi:hypothetical protein